MSFIQLHLFAIKRSAQLMTSRSILRFILPGLIISIFFYLFIGGLNYTSSVVSLLEKTPWIGSFLESVFSTLFSWIENLSFSIYQFTIITLLSPVNTVLSQRIEMQETGKAFEISYIKIIRDILRLIGVIIVWAILYGAVYLLWILFAKIIGISFLNPYISLIIIAFFTGFNFYDHSLERHDINIIKSWKYAFQRPLHMITIGLIFAVILLIPFVGVIIAPVYSTIVATVVFFKEKDAAN